MEFRGVGVSSIASVVDQSTGQNHYLTYVRLARIMTPEVPGVVACLGTDTA